jgi:hypothetical protein
VRRLYSSEPTIVKRVPNADLVFVGFDDRT